jgi:protein phosphatase PTC7
MNKEVGSCTICVVTLDPDIGILNSAYLGDSIFSVYRNYREILQTHEQQHQFNKPYQVGTEGDNPASALKHHMQLSEGDVIVLGSDGLWDNLSKDQIEGIVRNALTLDFIAEEVALRSYRYSLMGDYNSPFYEKAKKLGINCPKTGKSDDITVVAATVVRIQN